MSTWNGNKRVPVCTNSSANGSVKSTSTSSLPVRSGHEHPTLVCVVWMAWWKDYRLAVGNMDSTTLWERVLEALSHKLNDRTIETLLRPLEALDATSDTLGNVFFLQAPNEFSREWVSRNYEALIQEQLAAVGGGAWTIYWTVKPPIAKSPDAGVSSSPSVPPTAPVRRAGVPQARKPVAARSTSISPSSRAKDWRTPPAVSLAAYIRRARSNALGRGRRTLTSHAAALAHHRN